MKDFQYITNSHPSYIEGLYQDFVKDPNSVEAEMRKFFEGFDFAVSNGRQTTDVGPRTTANGQPKTDNPQGPAGGQPAGKEARGKGKPAWMFEIRLGRASCVLK